MKKRNGIPYVLAKGITLEDYEERVDKFKIHGCWEWSNGSAKEADDSFRPEKSAVTSPNGSDGKTRPWPNLIVEVSYSETIDHVTEKVRDYWLCLGRVHDGIVVKIDPVQQGQIPSRMKAWHYCVSDRRTRNILPVRTDVMLDYLFANISNISKH